MASFWKVGHQLITFCCVLAISTANYQHKSLIQSNQLYCCYLPSQERDCLVTPEQQQIDCPEPLIHQVDCPPLKQPSFYSQQIDCLPVQNLIPCFDPCAETRPSGDTIGFRYASIQEKNPHYADDRGMMPNQNTAVMPNPYQDAQQTPGILNKVAGATQNVNNRLKTFYKSMPQHAIGQLDDGLPRLAQYETDPIPSNYQQQSQFYNTLGDRVQHVDDLFQSSPIKVPRPYYFHDDRQVPSSYRTVGTNGQLAPSSSKRTTIPSLHSTRQRASPYNAQRPSSTGEDQWGQYAGDQPSRTLFDSAAVAPRYGDFRQRPGSYKPAESLFRGQEKQPYQFEDNVRRSSSYNPFATPTMYRDHELGPPFYNPAVQQLPPNTYQSDEHQSEVSFALQPGNPQRAPPSGSPSHSIPQDLDPQTIRDQLSAPPNLSLHTPSRISPRHAALSLAKSNVNNRPPTSSIPTTDSLLSMLPNTQSSVLSDPSETADSPHSICGRSTFGPKVLLSCFSLLDPFDIPFRVLNATSSSPTSTAPAPGAKAAAAKTERDAKDGVKAPPIKLNKKN